MYSYIEEFVLKYDKFSLSPTANSHQIIFASKLHFLKMYFMMTVVKMTKMADFIP